LNKRGRRRRRRRRRRFITRRFFRCPWIRHLISISAGDLVKRKDPKKKTFSNENEIRKRKKNTFHRSVESSAFELPEFDY